MDVRGASTWGLAELFITLSCGNGDSRNCLLSLAFNGWRLWTRAAPGSFLKSSGIEEQAEALGCLECLERHGGGWRFVPFASHSQEKRDARSENQLPEQDNINDQMRTGTFWLSMCCKECKTMCKTEGLLVGSSLLCLPTRKGQQVLPGKFFLDDLIVVHWVWSQKQMLDKSQPEPSPGLQRGQAGKKKACDWAKEGAGQAG